MNIADVVAPADAPELAVLDADGVVVAVNASWQHFARENGAADGWTGVGTSYLDVCDGAGDATSLAVARAIRAAVRGELAGWAAIEVPCHSPGERRWFDVVVCPRFDEHGRSVGATVSVVRLGGREPAAGYTPAVDRWLVDGLSLDDYPDALVAVDHDGVVVAVNDALCRLFGHRSGDVVGRSLEQLVPTGSRGMHRRLREGFGHAPRRRAMGSVAQVLAGQHADGSTVPVRVTLSPAVLRGRPVVLAAVRDASAVVAAEAQAHLIADLLDVTTDAIAVHAAEDLHPVWVNRTLADLSGRSRDELLHDPDCAADVLDVDTLRATAVPLLEGRADSVDLRGLLPRRDAAALPVGVRVVYRERSPGEGYLVVVRRDLTDTERAQAERERVARLEERARIARDLHDSVIQALYAGGMRLSATLDHVVDPLARSRIEEATLAMDTAIEQLRGTIARLAEPAGPVPVRDLLEAVVAMQTPALPYAPTLTLSGDPELLPGEVVEELVPIITEAMSNVARHAGARTTEVGLAVALDGTWEVSIRDDGCGFDPVTTPRGQGLANLAARATLVRATLAVRSVPGKGTEIVVRCDQRAPGPLT